MKNKRILALLMAVMMCLSLLPMGALADEEIAEVPAEAVEEVIPAPEPEAAPEPEPEPAPAEEIPAEEPAEGIEPEPEPAPEPAEAIEEPAAAEEPAGEPEVAEEPAEEEPAEEAPVEEDELPAPAADGASESIYVDEDGAICVSSLSDLESVLQYAASADDMIWIRVISGSTFVIEWSISIPSSVQLEFGGDVTVIVPAGVTVTNYGYLYGYILNVNGTLQNYGGMYPDDLNITGSLVNAGYIYIYAALTGAEKIRTATAGENEPFVAVIRYDSNSDEFLDTLAMAEALPSSVRVADYPDDFLPSPERLPDNMTVEVSLYPDSEAELRSMAQTVSTSYEGLQGWSFWLSLNGPISLSRDLTIPKNMVLSLGAYFGEDDMRVASLSIPSGVTMTLNGDINAVGGSVSINGTLINNGWIYIGQHSVSMIGNGSIALQYNGKYRGDGTLMILSELSNTCMTGFGSVSLGEYDDGYYTYYWMVMDGTFVADTTGYKFQFSDGTYAKSQLLTFDGTTYYFDSRGYIYLGTGWQTLNGNKYYFRSGAMATGLQQIEGSWYYFNDDGTMFKGWLPYGGAVYYYDASGKLALGWQTIGNYRYYFDPGTAKMAIGLKKIGDYYYLFNENGTRFTGWVRYNGAMYYYETNESSIFAGILVTGLEKIPAGTYSFLDGSTTRVLETEEGWYYFNTSTAKMFTGLLKYGGSYYYYKDNGVLYSGWLDYGGETYFYDESDSFRLATGWKDIPAGTYNYINGTEVGTKTVEGGRYYFNPSTAKMYAGGTYTIGGTTYKFDDNGLCIG